jgi:WXG100 family type VII secretion target
VSAVAQGSGFQTETPVMQAAFQQVTEISGNIQGQIAQIESTLEMLSSGWQGSAFNQFRALGSQIQADCAQINQFIAWLGTTGLSNVKTYGSAETANLETTSTLK